MKMMVLAPRRDGMTHEAFRRYVTERRGPLVKSIPEVARAIRRYHYNFSVFGGRAQRVVATLSRSLSAGVIKPKVSLGL